MDKKSLSHTTWKCQYHIVFISKYRKKRLYGQVRTDVREIIQTLCGYKGVEIVSGAVCIDHVHLCISIPLKMSVSSFMGYLNQLLVFCRPGSHYPAGILGYGTVSEPCHDGPCKGVACQVSDGNRFHGAGLPQNPDTALPAGGSGGCAGHGAQSLRTDFLRLEERERGCRL